MYYKRQFNLYNLGIYDEKTGRGIFNVWTENIASRGAQEVGLCLMKFISKNIKPPIKELHL